jgi:hypothetical protein
MTRSLSFRILAALISITLGVLFWRLPEQWIELQFGTNLDGGSGLVEFLLAIVPTMLGVALVFIITPAVGAKKTYRVKHEGPGME